jgi:hypothetical protein
MPKMKHRATISVTAGMTVNAIVWITSPDDADERQSTQQILTFLEPFLQAIRVPFFLRLSRRRQQSFSSFSRL